MRLFHDSFNKGTYVKDETIDEKRKVNPNWNPPVDSPYSKQLRRLEQIESDRKGGDSD